MYPNGDARFLTLSYRGITGDFLLELSDGKEQGVVYFENDSAHFSEGKFFYSAPGFTEGETDGQLLDFDIWVEFSLNYIYTRGQGVIKNNYLMEIHQLKKLKDC